MRVSTTLISIFFIILLIPMTFAFWEKPFPNMNQVRDVVDTSENGVVLMYNSINSKWEGVQLNITINGTFVTYPYLYSNYYTNIQINTLFYNKTYIDTNYYTKAVTNSTGLIGLTCADGEILEFETSTGLWECGTDSSGVSEEWVEEYFVPYTGATGNVDLNNKDLVNINNVGIGTATPTEKLEVNGNILAQKGTTLALIVDDTIGKATSLFAGGQSSAFQFDEDGYFIIRSTTKARIVGGLGIGDIWFTIKNDGASSIGGRDVAPGASLTIMGDGTRDLLRVSSDTTTASGKIGDLLTLTKDGNVGIGITTPTEKLEVNGNLFLNGQVNITNDLEVNGNITSDEYILGKNQVTQLHNNITIIQNSIDTWKNISWNLKIDDETTTGYTLLDDNESIQFNYNGIVRVQGCLHPYNNNIGNQEAKILVRTLINNVEARCLQVSKTKSFKSSGIDILEYVGTVKVENGQKVQIQWRVDNTNIELRGDTDFDNPVSASVNLERISN